MHVQCVNKRNTASSAGWYRHVRANRLMAAGLSMWHLCVVRLEPRGGGGNRLHNGAVTAARLDPGAQRHAVSLDCPQHWQRTAMKTVSLLQHCTRCVCFQCCWLQGRRAGGEAAAARAVAVVCCCVATVEGALARHQGAGLPHHLQPAPTLRRLTMTWVQGRRCVEVW